MFFSAWQSLWWEGSFQPAVKKCQFKGSGVVGFCLFLQRAAREMFFLHLLHFAKMHCCLQFLREEDNSCCSAASGLSDAAGRVWQGRTAAVTSGCHSCAALVAACCGVAGKCTCPQSVTQLCVGKEVSLFPCYVIPPLPAHLHLKQLFLSWA